MHERSNHEAADTSAQGATLHLLGSPAAHDMLWYHRERAAAFGFRAASLEGGGGGACVETASRLHDQRIRLLREDATVSFRPVVRPIDEERRIRAGLSRISANQREWLRIAYEAKLHAMELHNELGLMADVAFYLPCAITAYEHYREKFLAAPKRARPLGAPSSRFGAPDAPYSMETWLCVVAKSNAPLLTEIRDARDKVVRGSLTAYALAVVPQPRAAPPPPKPRAPRTQVSVSQAVATERAPSPYLQW